MAAALTCRPTYGVRFAELRRDAKRNVGFSGRSRAADVAVERFLLDFSTYRQTLSDTIGGERGWLLGFRGEFRTILLHRPCIGLQSFLSNGSPEDPSFLIGVWLLGRCASRQTSFNLDRLPAGGDSQSRKHYARALRRVESWSRLRQLAAENPGDAYVAAMLASTPAETFSRRLRRFAAHVDKSHAAEAAFASRMPLWFRNTNWQRTEPNRPGWIRVLLERIRQWVHGE